MNNEQEHVSVKKNKQRRTKRRKSFQTVDMSTQYGEWKSQNRVINELVVAELNENIFKPFIGLGFILICNA